MVVTTRRVKQTIDPALSSVVECDTRKKDKVEEASRELGDAPSKEAKLSQIVIPIPIPPSPFA